MKLRTHLIILVTVAVVPVVVFASAVVALLTREQARTVETGLRGATRALTAAVDERVGAVLASLRLLGAAEEVNDSTLHEVHRRAVRAIAGEEGWYAISLATPDGQHVFSTTRPFGEALPALAPEVPLDRVLRTRGPVVSGFHVGEISGLPMVSIAVPVLERGVVRYVLVARVSSESLSRLLQAQDIPSDWTAAILDAEGRLIARSRAPERFVGRKATAKLAALSREHSEGVFEDVTQEGDPARGVFHRSDLSGWTVVLGVPQPAGEARRSESLWIIVGGGATLLLLGIGLALVLGVRISKPIVALSTAAAAVGRGESPLRSGSSIVEIAGVERALQQAAAQRHRSEESLRHANQTFDLLIRSSPVAIVVIDAAGMIKLWNPAAEQILGCSADAAVGRRMGEVDGGRFAALERFLVSTFAGEALNGREFKQSGRERASVLQVSTAALRTGEDGAPVDAMALIEDITARTHSLERLAEERQTVDTLHHIGSALAAELDLQRLVQLLTDEAVALTGAEFGAYFHTTEAPGGEIRLYTLSGAPYEAFSKFPAPRPTALFGPTLRGEAVVRIDDVTQDPRYGKDAPYHGMPPGHLPVRSYLAVPVISRTREVLGGLFFGHSRPGVFTARHERLMVSVASQAAVALDNARLYRSAHEAVRLRDDFLSVASHELKTPLTPLQLHVQMLLMRAAKDPTSLTPELVVKTLQKMEGRLSRLALLIEDLLDVSRIAAGQLQLVPEPFDLVALVREIVEQYDIERARSGATIRFDAPEQLVGTWDRGRVEQVVTNLLTNALKYGERQPIDIAVGQEGEHVVVRVRDRGIGIATEDQQRIFERFERAVSHRQYSGLGLGLWIVRRVVEAMGGALSLESAPGAGATFTVRLPLHAAASEQGGGAGDDSRAQQRL